MPHGPVYDFSPDEKPDVCWKKKDGSWLGFWPREWLDLLGEAVLKETDQYDWEVWQPDFRAERIYSKTLDTGVTHRLFPARERICRPGVRPQKGFFSEPMVSRLKTLQNGKMILMLYNTYGFNVPFFNEILKTFGPAKKFPIFFRGGGQFKAPLSEMYGLHRPVTYLCLIVEHLRLKKLIKYVDVISEQSELALREVRKVYNGRIEKLTMGCYCDFWTPVPSEEIEKKVRKKLSILDNRTVFLATGNFVSLKQFDKLIEVFQKLSGRNEFLLVIVGHGDKTNTHYLRSLARGLVLKNQVVIHPYATGKALRDLYWASDVYISVSTGEGGPVSVMKAMACGLPVLSTPVGETSDRMKKYGVGKFVPVKNYDEWTTAILEILDKGIPKALDIRIVRDAYDWPNVARRFINLYRDLCKRYYGKT